MRHHCKLHLCLQHRSQGGRPISITARASDTNAYQIRFPETWKPLCMSPPLFIIKPPSLWVRKRMPVSLSLTASGNKRLRRRNSRPYLSFRGSCTEGVSWEAPLSARSSPMGTQPSFPYCPEQAFLSSSRTVRGGPPKLSRDQLGSRQTDSLSGDEC